MGELIPWSPEEDALLMRLVSKGLTAPEIARILGRTVGAVYGRLHKLKK